MSSHEGAHSLLTLVEPEASPGVPAHITSARSRPTDTTSWSQQAVTLQFCRFCKESIRIPCVEIFQDKIWKAHFSCNNFIFWHLCWSFDIFRETKPKRSKQGKEIKAKPKRPSEVKPKKKPYGAKPKKPFELDNWSKTKKPWTNQGGREHSLKYCSV